MSNPAQHNRAFLEEISDTEAWSSPPARSEAARCLAVARANGGVEHMRELIAVSDGERAELLAWAVEEPTLTSKILGVVAYRERVLTEFDELVAAENLASGILPSC